MWDSEKNVVYCPAGGMLCQKSVKKNGDIRFANKTACRDDCLHRDKCFRDKSDHTTIRGLTLTSLGYSLVRAVNLLGFQKIMEKMA